MKVDTLHLSDAFVSPVLPERLPEYDNNSSASSEEVFLPGFLEKYPAWAGPQP